MGTAEKGRLSEEEIERMVQEAEEFAEEDKKTKERIDGRNGLEGYCYNLKNILEDEEKGIADKISEEDKETLEEALEWLDDNQEAEKEDYEEKQKELEGVANPIIQAVYQAEGGGEGGDDDEEEDEDEDEDEL